MNDKTDKPTDNTDGVDFDKVEPAAESTENESLTFSELDASSEQEVSGEEVSVTDLDAVYGIPVEVTAVLGKSNMPVSSLLKLGRGAVIELDRKVGEAIDIYVNNRLVARGEVVVVEDKLGITMTEIIKAERTT